MFITVCVCPAKHCPTGASPSCWWSGDVVWTILRGRKDLQEDMIATIREPHPPHLPPPPSGMPLHGCCIGQNDFVALGVWVSHCIPFSPLNSHHTVPLATSKRVLLGHKQILACLDLHTAMIGTGCHGETLALASVSPINPHSAALLLLLSSWPD